MYFHTKLSGYLRQHDRAWVLSLLALVGIVYLPFLGNPFVFDDLHFMTGANLSHYATAPFRFDLRWFPYASLGWTYAIFSDVTTHFYHLGNVLLHAGNVILLFYLLRLLVGAVIIEHDKSATLIWGAWFGALLFACHPVAVYAVGYVVERSILMATFFSLLMQLAYVKGLLSGKKRWLVLAVIAYFMAGFSKEHSVLMPAVLVVITIVLRARIIVDKRSLALTWVSFMAIAMLLVLSAKGVLGTAYEPMAATLFEQQGMFESTPTLHLMSALTQAGLFFKYLFLWVLPNPAWMSVDMREPFVSSLSELKNWAGALGFVAYGVLAFRMLLRPRWLGLIGFALVYPWLLFLVEFASIRVQEPFVLYRSYLWMPGLTLLIPLLMLNLPGRSTRLALGLAVLLALLLAWNRLWVFSNDYRLWNDAVLLMPNERANGADRIFYNRGEASSAARRWEEAAMDFNRAMLISPQLAPIHHELGVAYFNAKRYQDAVEQLNTAIALAPEYERAYFDLGMTLKYLHQDELAMQQMKKSCELKYAMACVVVMMAPPKK